MTEEELKRENISKSEYKKIMAELKEMKRLWFETYVG